MKRKTLSAIILFVVAFVVTYLILCFGIPGMRIKLEAGPAQYFLASVKHMALFKSLISLVVGAILGVLSIAIRTHGDHKG